MKYLYKLACILVSCYYKLIYFTSVTGRENIPKDGGFLICSNHKSNNDPPFIAASLTRQIKFLAKKELFDIPILGWLIRGLGAIPLNRGAADTSAIKASLTIMRDGFGLLVFPQGGRRKGFILKDIHPGSVSMAFKVGVPVLPVGISGNYKIFGRTKLIIGKPVSPEELTALVEASGGDKNAAFTQLLYDRIGTLINE